MRRIRIITSVLAAFVFSVVRVGECAPAWPSHRGDIQQTGRTSAVSHLDPGLLWADRTSDSITGSPVMDSSGTLYVASTSGHLLAYDRDGVRRWAYDTQSPIFGSPAIGPDGTLYVGNLSGGVFGVWPGGEQRWSYALPGAEARILNSPAVAPSGAVYVCAWDGRLHAFSPGGTHLWGVSLGGYLSASPAIDTTGTIYVVGYNDDDLVVYARKPDNSEKWTFRRDMGSTSSGQFSTFIKSSVCVDEPRGRLYVGANCPDKGFFCCLALSDGHVLGWFEYPRSIYSAPAVGPDGTVYFGALDGKLYAIDPVTGVAKWSYQTGGDFIFGSPLIDGEGFVYVGASDGALYKIRPDGTLAWLYQTNADIRSTPLIDENGRIYFGSFDSRIYAIGAPTSARHWRRY